MLKLLIATNNPNKVKEFAEILADLPLAVTYLADESITLDPEETGATFRENAILKAQAFAQASGLLTLADDSGLEVDALGGEPGVYSARYGNTAKDDHVGRCHLVLDKLAAQNVPWPERTARFRCVIALATPERLIETVEGTVEGLIDYKLKGSNGFGYDPIFFVPELNQTLGEAPGAVKHQISHRGRAARAAAKVIERLMKDQT
ncbi:MAG: RdgB/HAM1 family non-canonical purine NTP pyrophosphatase [Anaerolineales bacterium]|nr:RdgB/HAM1 family non-canonical purine NTP pyrophosphatase [Anaerolineales bacterium]